MQSVFGAEVVIGVVGQGPGAPSRRVEEPATWRGKLLGRRPVCVTAMSAVTRFSQVVKRCGRPTPYVPWTAPAKDPSFRSALKQHRVMTVHLEMRGGKKDFGTVGFQEEPRAQYLLFPRSLRAFTHQRVVGVKYDLLAAGQTTAGPRPPLHVAPAKDRPPKSRALASQRQGPRKQIAEVVEFPSTPKEVPKPAMKAARTSRKIPSIDPVVAREIKKALLELKGDKPEAAFARLTALLG